MFKLLTEEEKQKVTHEYTARRTICMLSALSIILAAGVIGLLPSYVFSSARQNEAFERAKAMDHTGETSDGPALQAWLEAVNYKLQILSPALDTDRPSDALGHILEQKMAGIRIVSFSWVKTNGKTAISVSGVATDRQSLLAFENRINASGRFSNVTLPLSDLAKDKDINFQMKFSP